MSNLRQAAQQALEALERINAIHYLQDLYEALDWEIDALRAALAEPEQEPVAWEQFHPDIGKPQTTHWEGCEAVHPECRKPEQEPFMVVAPECAERGCMAHDDRVDGSGIVVQLRKEQEEVRRLHAELERKSDAIQRLWKERDELRAVLTKIVGSK